MAVAANLGAAAASLAVAASDASVEARQHLCHPLQPSARPALMTGWEALGCLVRRVVSLPGVAARTEYLLEAAYLFCDSVSDPLGLALASALEAAALAAPPPPTTTSSSCSPPPVDPPPGAERSGADERSSLASQTSGGNTEDDDEGSESGEGHDGDVEWPRAMALPCAASPHRPSGGQSGHLPAVHPRFEEPLRFEARPFPPSGLQRTSSALTAGPTAVAAAAAAAAATQRAGGVLLLALFETVPDARPAILSYVFDALAQEDATPTQRRLWAALLTTLTDSNLGALYAHAAQLIDWTDCLPRLPLDMATEVLRALLPLVAFHSEFGRMRLCSPYLTLPHLTSPCLTRL